MNGCASPHLGDFSTDRRVLILVAMAVLVGVGGALSAWLLLRIIALATNLIWLHTLSAQSLSLADVKRSLGTYSAYLAPKYLGNAADYLATLRNLRSMPAPDVPAQQS